MDMNANQITAANVSLAVPPSPPHVSNVLDGSTLSTTSNTPLSSSVVTPILPSSGSVSRGESSNFIMNGINNVTLASRSSNEQADELASANKKKNLKRKRKEKNDKGKKNENGKEGEEGEEGEDDESDDSDESDEDGNDDEISTPDGLSDEDANNAAAGNLDGINANVITAGVVNGNAVVVASSATPAGAPHDRKKALKKMYKQRYQQKKSIKKKLTRFFNSTGDRAVVIFVTKNRQRRDGYDTEFFNPSGGPMALAINAWWEQVAQKFILACKRAEESKGVLMQNGANGSTTGLTDSERLSAMLSAASGHGIQQLPPAPALTSLFTAPAYLDSRTSYAYTPTAASSANALSSLTPQSAVAVNANATNNASTSSNSSLSAAAAVAAAAAAASVTHHPSQTQTSQSYASTQANPFLDLYYSRVSNPTTTTTSSATNSTNNTTFASQPFLGQKADDYFLFQQQQIQQQQLQQQQLQQQQSQQQSSQQHAYQSYQQQQTMGTASGYPSTTGQSTFGYGHTITPAPQYHTLLLPSATTHAYASNLARGTPSSNEYHTHAAH